MDLITALTSQFGLDTEKAEGLVGAVLGKVEEQVSAKLGQNEASSLHAAIPELLAWKAKGEALGQGGGEGGLLGGVGGLLGGAGGLLSGAAGLLGKSGSGLDLGALIQVVQKSGISASSAQAVVPLLLKFLESRLDPQLLSRVLSLVPALKGLGGGGGLAGALGGLL
jgi:hypothetical protein